MPTPCCDSGRPFPSGLQLAYRLQNRGHRLDRSESSGTLGPSEGLHTVGKSHTIQRNGHNSRDGFSQDLVASATPLVLLVHPRPHGRLLILPPALWDSRDARPCLL